MRLWGYEAVMLCFYCVIYKSSDKPIWDWINNTFPNSKKSISCSVFLGNDDCILLRILYKFLLTINVIWLLTIHKCLLILFLSLIIDQFIRLSTFLKIVKFWQNMDLWHCIRILGHNSWPLSGNPFPGRASWSAFRKPFPEGSMFGANLGTMS